MNLQHTTVCYHKLKNTKLVSEFLQFWSEFINCLPQPVLVFCIHSLIKPLSTLLENYVPLNGKVDLNQIFKTYSTK